MKFNTILLIFLPVAIFLYLCLYHFGTFDPVTNVYLKNKLYEKIRLARRGCKLDKADVEREKLLSLSYPARASITLKKPEQSNTSELKTKEWSDLLSLKMMDKVKNISCEDSSKRFNESIFHQMNLFSVETSMSGPVLQKNISCFAKFKFNSKKIRCEFFYIKRKKGTFDGNIIFIGPISIPYDVVKISLEEEYNAVGIKCTSPKKYLAHLLQDNEENDSNDSGDEGEVEDKDEEGNNSGSTQKKNSDEDKDKDNGSTQKNVEEDKDNGSTQKKDDEDSGSTQNRDSDNGNSTNSGDAEDEDNGSTQKNEEEKEDNGSTVKKDDEDEDSGSMQNRDSANGNSTNSGDDEDKDNRSTQKNDEEDEDKGSTKKKYDEDEGSGSTQNIDLANGNLTNSGDDEDKDNGSTQNRNSANGNSTNSGDDEDKDNGSTQKKDDKDEDNGSTQNRNSANGNSTNSGDDEDKYNGSTQKNYEEDHENGSTQTKYDEDEASGSTQNRDSANGNSTNSEDDEDKDNGSTQKNDEDGGDNGNTQKKYDADKDSGSTQNRDSAHGNSTNSGDDEIKDNGSTQTKYDEDEDSGSTQNRNLTNGESTNSGDDEDKDNGSTQKNYEEANDNGSTQEKDDEDSGSDDLISNNTSDSEEKSDSDLLFYQDIFMYIPKVNKSQNTTGSKPDYSVIIYTIDSASRSTFQRNLPLTTNYLKEGGAVLFKNHHRLGENSYPNVVPLLAGRKMKNNQDGEGLLDTGIMEDVMAEHNMTWGWTLWEEEGFPTMYHSDQEGCGLFNLHGRHGWYGQPTTIYHRPAYLAMDAWDIRNNDLHGRCPSYLCINNTPLHRRQLDIVSMLAKTYCHSPYFAYLHPSEYSHDKLNLINNMDNDFLQTLQELDSIGCLNKTLLIIMGDHGFRGGKKSFSETRPGWLDANTPLLFIRLPEQLKERHPDIQNILINNQNKMTTMLDIHKTFTDPIITNKKPQSTSGLSLLHPLPERTCEDALVPSDFCTCPPDIKELDSDNSDLINPSEEITSYINDIANQSYCAELEFDRVEWAFKEKEAYHIQLVLTAEIMNSTGDVSSISPLFHAVFQENDHAVESVRRTELYHPTSKCVTDDSLDHIRPFCICYNQTSF